MNPIEIVKIFFEQLTNGRIESEFKLVDNNVIWWVGRISRESY